MLKLYDYFRSSASYRVRIALNLKSLSPEIMPIHLLNNGGEQFSINYQKINPQNLVPSLLDDDKVVTQSLAIIEYLNDLHPHPPLLPTDPFAKSEIRAFALTIVADIHPLNNLRVLNYLSQQFSISAEEKNNWIQHWIYKGFFALENKLATRNKKTDFCFGDEPSLADICLVPQMYNARRFNCNLNEFPNLVRIDAHCQTESAFSNAIPVEI